MLVTTPTYYDLCVCTCNNTGCVPNAQDLSSPPNDFSRTAPEWSGFATALGIAAIPLGILFPLAGIAVAISSIRFDVTGGTTATGGTIGVVVGVDRLRITNEALDKVESLSTDLESVKRNVSAINTTMENVRTKLKLPNKVVSMHKNMAPYQVQVT